MTAPTSPPTGGRTNYRFSLRSSTKSSNKRGPHKGVRFWFSSSPKGTADGGDLAADAVAAAREVDTEVAETKPRAESGSGYVPRVEYGSPRTDVEERDAPWTSDEEVEAHYAALDWAVISIAKDGNCLFRAISDQLYTNELFHQDIRRRLVDFIEREQQLFRPFVEDEELSDYCTRMRRDGEWGGHLELYAAARLFNIHIVVHTGPVRRLRVTNDDEGDTEKQSPPPPPPYRILQLLYKDDHYSSLHSNEPVQMIEPATTTAATIDDTTDKRARSPTKAHDSPDKKCVNVQKSPSKCVSIKNLPKRSYKAQDPNGKTVKFKEAVEAKPPPREEGKTFLYQEEELPECGVYLPKQVLFKRGKRRVSGATLFSLVHVPSSSNLSPVVESLSTSESSTSSKCSSSTECSSSSEEHENQSETKAPLPTRPKPKAPTLRAVPVEFPSKTIFHKGRAAAAVC
ncbi:hypothetical protein PRIC1_012879 [Phytophthora ramorum]